MNQLKRIEFLEKQLIIKPEKQHSDIIVAQDTGRAATFGKRFASFEEAREANPAEDIDIIYVTSEKALDALESLEKKLGAMDEGAGK